MPLITNAFTDDDALTWGPDSVQDSVLDWATRPDVPTLANNAGALNPFPPLIKDDIAVGYMSVGHRAIGLDAIAYAREVVSLGAGEILVTSKDRDGTQAGYDVELTRAISDAVSVPVIASGGAGTLDHLVENLLERAGADELVHLHVAPLADAKRAVRRLILHGRVPPPVEMKHVIGARQVQPNPTGLDG